MNERPIANFFSNREIFVTGGSGFMGKVLIEKLARSCPKIKAIYVLIRQKKEKPIDERLSAMLALPLFDKLRNSNPENLKKIIAISGNVPESKLGMSENDIKRLSNVSIVYHSAASVRFDDPLQDAILMNTKGTYEIIKFAKTLKNLAAFVHVSTAYCNPDKFEIEEKIYPEYADWKISIKIAENFETETLEPLSSKYRCMLPNTYTFTKNLAEIVVNDYKDQLPCVIFRPTIVIAALKEPIPGWIDSFNGPVSNLTACGLGILKTSLLEPDCENDYVPVDIATRAMLVATYKKGISKTDTDRYNLDIINCSVRKFKRLTSGILVELGKELVEENPLERTVLMPSGSITRCWYWHTIRVFLFQILVAIILDNITKLVSNQRPFLLHIQRKIASAYTSITYFLVRAWDFENENFCKLEDLVTSGDYEDFGFLKDTTYDFRDYYRNALIGAKMYLLHEPGQCTKAGWRRIKILKFLNMLYYVICSWIGYKFIVLSLTPLIKSYI